MTENIFILVFAVIGITVTIYLCIAGFLKFFHIKEWQNNSEYRLQKLNERDRELTQEIQIIHQRLAQLEQGYRYINGTNMFQK